ncbi:murein hydrolase activator EnvC family protein [Enterovirga aerilata]|uniref:Peptidoglycan DD-metalloendopeptidase family protein n=1 Tax=Enterovirga aerilata TaxID=2730920 RepID=A0A849I3D7_9HYPH|nr:peptidoglycan DD-metalloendopeptidase family protein [Enterovirga sp. DB1703]NNM70899.1 peptidoglycan DD-metalloendopeptidase family protein [Enterovirga sp. DB1703]
MVKAAIPGMALLVALAGSCQQGVAQDRSSEIEARAAAKEAERLRREEALRELDRRAAESREAGRKLASEIEALRTDNARLSSALVATAARIRDTEASMRALEAELATIEGSETALRDSLESRRAVIADVLAALQRLGRGAAPAMLVRPEDILAAIRSAILLGAVVPGLRDEAQSLATDLGELVRLRDLRQANRAALERELDLLRQDDERLQVLVRLRSDRLKAAEASLGEERARSAALGAEARSLKELVDRLDGELGAARREAEAERRRAEAEARQVRERFAAASSRDPARLAPKIPFAEARGTLARPVIGPVAREFGAPDGQGGTMRGIVIATRPKALVTSPADGWVSYAGPFRSFGRLLIINAGDGYYLLLAGMDRISVETGQFVLAGEPVGQMGEGASSSAALSVVEGNGPALYVEFRKDGGPVDPRPWWAKSQSERVRG